MPVIELNLENSTVEQMRALDAALFETIAATVGRSADDPEFLDSIGYRFVFAYFAYRHAEWAPPPGKLRKQLHDISKTADRLADQIEKLELDIETEKKLWAGVISAWPKKVLKPGMKMKMFMGLAGSWAWAAIRPGTASDSLYYPRGDRRRRQFAPLLFMEWPLPLLEDLAAACAAVSLVKTKGRPTNDKTHQLVHAAIALLEDMGLSKTIGESSSSKLMQVVSCFHEMLTGEADREFPVIVKTCIDEWRTSNSDK